MVLAASNNSRSTTAANASCARIHISGSFWTRFFFSLKDWRFPNIVAHIFFIDQNLVDGSSGPRTPEVCGNATPIEIGCNLAFAVPLMNKRAVDFTNQIDFLGRAQR